MRPATFSEVNLFSNTYKLVKPVAGVTSIDVRTFLLTLRLIKLVKPVKVIDVSLLFCTSRPRRLVAGDASNEVRRLSYAPKFVSAVRPARFNVVNLFPWTMISVRPVIPVNVRDDSLLLAILIEVTAVMPVMFSVSRRLKLRVNEVAVVLPDRLRLRNCVKPVRPVKSEICRLERSRSLTDAMFAVGTELSSAPES